MDLKYKSFWVFKKKTVLESVYTTPSVMEKSMPVIQHAFIGIQSTYIFLDSRLAYHDLLPPSLSTDQPHSTPFSSENEAQGGDSARWQCTAPSTSPSGGTPSHPSRPSSRPESHTPSRSLRETKKRSLSYSNKPAHMRRNIRYDLCPLRTSKLAYIEGNI